MTRRLGPMCGISRGWRGFGDQNWQRIKNFTALSSHLLRLSRYRKRIVTGLKDGVSQESAAGCQRFRPQRRHHTKGFRV